MELLNGTVDERNPAPVNRWFIRVYPIIYRVFTPSFWWCRISPIHSMSHLAIHSYRDSWMAPAMESIDIDLAPLLQPPQSAPAGPKDTLHHHQTFINNKWHMAI